MRPDIKIERVLVSSKQPRLGRVVAYHRGKKFVYYHKWSVTAYEDIEICLDPYLESELTRMFTDNITEIMK